jgi:hypothetical protein
VASAAAGITHKHTFARVVRGKDSSREIFEHPEGRQYTLNVPRSEAAFLNESCESFRKTMVDKKRLLCPLLGCPPKVISLLLLCTIVTIFFCHFLQEIFFKHFTPPPLCQTEELKERDNKKTSVS